MLKTSEESTKYLYTCEVNNRVLNILKEVWKAGLKVQAICLLRETHKGMSLTDARTIFEDLNKETTK